VNGQLHALAALSPTFISLVAPWAPEPVWTMEITSNRIKTNGKQIRQEMTYGKNAAMFHKQAAVENIWNYDTRK
jgi:hypothetical protein